MFLFGLIHIPSVLHLSLRQQVSLVFLNHVEQMLFNLDNSGSQIRFEQVFNPLHFHFQNVQVLSLVPMLTLSLTFLADLPIFHIYLFAYSLHQSVLIWQNFWRHFFLPQKLLHLKSIDVQRALSPVQLIDHRVVLRISLIHLIDILLVIILIFSAVHQIFSKPLGEKGRSMLLLQS